MPKQQIHNEYFRRVYVKTVYGDKTRDPKLINMILDRDYKDLNSDDCEIMRKRLEQPYKSVIGECSSRRSCPTCGTKLAARGWVWSWGEYHNAKWHTVQHFCKACWGNVLHRLIEHRIECGCNFALIGYRGEALPSWLKLPKAKKVIKK